jgi:hypothetical protein
MHDTGVVRAILFGSLISFGTLLQAQPAQTQTDAQAAEARANWEAQQKRLNAIPDTPGSGPFAAMKEEVPSLPNQVVYRPRDLTKLGKTRLGLYVFGNGGCSDDGASARLHLLEIASHGYLAIAPGKIRNGPGATTPASWRGPVAGEFPPPPTSHTDLLNAIEWALAQNADPKSPLYDKLDPKAIAVSGFSCGGLQALLVAPDPRVKTVVIMNSGIYTSGARIPSLELPKSQLDKLHTPTLYILGGKTDIAYENGMDDYRRIEHVPVMVANLDVGHGGTYWEPNGGKAAAAVVAWLNWQLRGDEASAKWFVGERCGLCTDAAWTVEKKRID